LRIAEFGLRIASAKGFGGRNPQSAIRNPQSEPTIADGDFDANTARRSYRKITSLTLRADCPDFC
jgi:hypothetical protein